MAVLPADPRAYKSIRSSPVSLRSPLPLSLPLSIPFPYKSRPRSELPNMSAADVHTAPTAEDKAPASAAPASKATTSKPRAAKDKKPAPKTASTSTAKKPAAKKAAPAAKSVEHPSWKDIIKVC